MSESDQESMGDGYTQYTLAYAGSNNTITNDGALLFHFYILPEVLLLLFAAAAIISNAVVLGAFCRMRCVLTSNLMLVVSLCTADMMIGAGIVLERIRFPLGTGHCEATLSANLLLGMCVCSILNIALMAVDHYVPIVYYIKYGKLMSRIRMIICSITIWVFALVIANVHLMSAWIASLQRDDVTLCEAMIDDELSISYLGIAGVMYTAAIIAVIVMIFCYARIHIFLKKAVAAGDNIPAGGIDARSDRKRATVTTLWIMATFVALWIPPIILEVFITAYVSIDSRYSATVHAFERYMLILPVLNAVCDPIIYAARLRKVKEEIRCSGRSGVDETELSDVTHVLRPECVN